MKANKLIEQLSQLTMLTEPIRTWYLSTGRTWSMWAMFTMPPGTSSTDQAKELLEKGKKS